MFLSGEAREAQDAFIVPEKSNPSKWNSIASFCQADL
jgi:hypothetical protein